jgi:predicted nucleotidyltransferase
MKLASFEAIVRALNEAGVRYLVAGGLAVNAHGYQRLTVDVDLVIQLDGDNILAAFNALAGLGYRPTVPVTGRQFADPARRLEWIEQKGMRVLNLFSDTHRETPLDLFVTEPFDFDREYEAAMRGEIAPGLEVRFVSIPTLIAMKEAAGRPRDLDDIQHLRWIQEEQGPHEQEE